MGEIKIPTSEIPADEFKAVAKWFAKTKQYGRVDAGDPILAEAAKLAPSAAPWQLLSLRNSIMKDKIIKRFAIVQAAAHRISAGYSAGRTCLELTELFDFPPIHIMKIVVAYRGGEWPPTTGRDAEQYKLAAANDISSLECEAEVAAAANHAEQHFVDWIKRQGIECKTQADLVAEQVALHGRAISTPDILFTAPVVINGTPLMWIDFKNYVGAPIDFISKSNARQAARYTKEYGMGALAYGKGVVRGYTIPSAYLLDVSSVMASIYEQ